MNYYIIVVYYNNILPTPILYSISDNMGM